MTTAEEFDTEHLDRVTCLHINYDGTRILTGSIDHRIKVWTVDPHTQQRTLLDTWTAHDSDIRDAKWLHPSTGSHLGTTGNDLKFVLWGEDHSQAPNSGRRFRRLCTIDSPTRVPFVSLDFRNVDSVYTYLAIIDRQGLLSVYEPTNPDEFKDWTLIDRWNVVVPVPVRGEQTCFKVRWDQNVMPLPYVCSMSDERKQLSLVVTAGNEVKVYRGITSESKSRDTDGGTADGEASHRIKFYEACKLPPHPALVRDVQWALFNVRGTDLFATACKDGGVRIFEVSVSEPTDSNTSRGKSAAEQQNAAASTTQSQNSQNRPYFRQQSSTLTSAIAGGRQQAQPQSQALNQPQSNNQNSSSQSNTNTGHASNQTASAANSNLNTNNPSAIGAGNLQSHPNQSTTTTTTTTTYQASQSTISPKPLQSHDLTHPRNTHRFPYTSTITLQANLESAHDDAWSVSWDPNAQVLISGGADGSVKIWRRSVLDLTAEGEDEDGYENGRGPGGVAGAATTTNTTTGAGGRWLLFADQAVSFAGEGDEDQNGNAVDLAGSDDET